MDINWQSLRQFQGSVRTAFEELCCQLAACEPTCNLATAVPIAPESVFVRKGTPDAGVECYWRETDGSEIAWQAKFFTSTPERTQWQQLDKSVTTSLQKHPKLRAYVVCLPLDRADPRIDEQEWFMDCWDSHVERWVVAAKALGMCVEFKYWGTSEIMNRLSRDEHRGRRFFWFNKEYLSEQWFNTHVEETVVQVGPRYTPELHVEVPIASVLSALERTDEYVADIQKSCGAISLAMRRCEQDEIAHVDSEKLKSLEQQVFDTLSLVSGVWDSPIASIDWESVSESFRSALGLIWELDASLEEACISARKQTVESKSSGIQSRNAVDRIKRSQRYLWELSQEIGNIWEFAISNKAQLTNLPALLIVGAAGTGKTHLLCDTAKQRSRHGLPTVLLLGGRFTDEEPWTQIIRQLGLSCSTKEELLGALEAAGQAAGSRTLLLIDAINESHGKHLWKNYLGSMLEAIRRYPWVGIALTVRDSYEPVILDEQLIEQSLVREEHRGFESCEYDAVRSFFEYYKIELPSVPLLVPEFQNPLFLKLFCKALQNAGQTHVPEGLRGLTRIFDFFINQTNTKLASRDMLDYDAKTNMVKQAIDLLADGFAVEGQPWLSRDQAKETVNSCLPRQGHENTLFAHLLSEGILAENIRYSQDGTWSEVVHFGYEKFSDHVIAQHLLQNDFDVGRPEESLAADTPLARLFRNESACQHNRGLIEALALQIPEKCGRELPELRPEIAQYASVRMAFVDSLIWRRTDTINEATLRYVEQNVLVFRDSSEEFWHTMLALACRPQHPLNADRLHDYLSQFNMPERDSWWSIRLFDWYEESRHHGGKGVLNRLLDWACSAEQNTHIDGEVRRLAGIALAWMLTSSNRFLRDRATKAMVQLLSENLEILTQLLGQFEGVDDLYVQERLMAVAYGAVLRAPDHKGVKELAEYVYRKIFEGGKPVPHIVLRDYARGVIEFAIYAGVDVQIETERIRPPYHSSWPDNLPSASEIKEKYGQWQDDLTEEEQSLCWLHGDIMGSSDFARYIIGTNFGDSTWSNRKIGGIREPMPWEKVAMFEAGLSAEQKTGLTALRDASFQTGTLNWLKGMGSPGCEAADTADESSAPVTEGALERAYKAFLAGLSKDIKTEYLNLSQMLDSVPLHVSGKDPERFDLSMVQAFVFTRVLELGWTPERFAKFDRTASRYDFHGRGAKKPERIGKKYQWIALHECLARISDNFELTRDDSPEWPSYEGPWQGIGLRDIDPSWVLPRTQKQEWKSHQRTWWFPFEYTRWRDEPDDVSWVKEETLFPFKELITVRDDAGAESLCLQASYSVSEPVPPGEEASEYPTRQMWCMIKSYLVKKDDADPFYEWATTQDYWGNWMPDSIDQTGVFYGEFYWSPAYAFVDSPYYGHVGWTDGGQFTRLPCKVLITCDQYLWESNSYDCSIDENISIYIPADELVRGMELRHPSLDGQWYDKDGQLIAQDPSVSMAGPGALLVSKEALRDYLDRSGCEIVWTVMAEKRVLTGLSKDLEYPGHTVVNGAFRWLNGETDGHFRTEYQQDR